MRSTELIGQTLDDKYLIDSQLGQGGMGAVYTATHLGTKRPVALKIIIPQFMGHTEFVERFRREAEAAGRLCHPNVVNVTDFGIATLGSTKIAYLVMEYLKGCTLGTVLKEESKLRLDFVVNIVEQICAAIQEAHQQGIIHRDLKPDNIWLEPDGRGSYTVKVLDFGLAKLDNNPLPNLNSDKELNPINNKSSNKNTPVNIPTPSLATAIQSVEPSQPTSDETATQVQIVTKTDDETATQVQIATKDDETATQVQTIESKKESKIPRITRAEQVRTTGQLTQAGAILGTPLYMSPEQCCGEELDTRSDIYSLGVMTYEMLAGETPFTGNINALLTQHLTSIPPDLRIKRPDINKHVSSLIMSALNKKAEERPASAAIFAMALRARAETNLTHLKQALTFYAEHFPTLIRLSFFSYLPTLIFGLLIAISTTSKNGQKFAYFNGKLHGKFSSNIDSKPQLALVLILAILYFISYLLAPLISYAVITPTLAKLNLFPLRSTKINIVKTLKKHLKDILVTMPRLYGQTFLGMCLCCIPGIIYVLRYTLTVPIIVIEGLTGKPALERSKELTNRIKTKVFFTFIVLSLVPQVFSQLITPYTQNLSEIKTSYLMVNAFINIIKALLDVLPLVLISPIFCLMIIFLYFQACRYSGENLPKHFLDELEEENNYSNWQQQIQQQTRLRSQNITTNPNKSSR